MTRKLPPPRVVPATAPVPTDARSELDRWRERVDALEAEWDAAAEEYDAAVAAWCSRPAGRSPARTGRRTIPRSSR